MKEKAFVICTVRNATPEYRQMLEEFVAQKEKDYIIHLPHRDTNQKASSMDICLQNAEAIREASILFVFYLPNSQDTYFDMGVAFGMMVAGYKKTIRVIQAGEHIPGKKSFSNLLYEWEHKTL